MKTLISITILSILLNGCGFKPIYSSKNSNFEIIEIVNKNENKNSFSIEEMVMSLSNKEAILKVKLEFDYKESKETILKDSKGDPSKKKISIIVNLKVKNQKNNILSSKNFKEEFNYDVKNDKYNMAQYEESIITNLSNKISNDIIFLISTLK